MLQVTVFVTLLTIALTGTVEEETDPDLCRDFDINADTLKTLGLFTEEEVEAVIQEDQEDIESEGYSWDAVKGYEECEEFMFWKQGDREGEEKDNEEIRYNIFEENYKMDSDKKKGGKYSKYSKYLNNDDFDMCPKIKSMDAICEERECIEWKTLSDISGCGFQKRNLPGGYWTTTPIDISNMRSSRDAWFRMKGYFDGTANDRKVPVKMVLPVIKTWTLDKNYKIVAGRMHFYIPSELQDNPPDPTDEQVSLIRWDDMVIYNRVFVGYHRGQSISAKYPTYNRHLEQLWQALQKKGIEIYPYMAITAGYTRPWYGRQRQEVMFVDNASWN